MPNEAAPILVTGAAGYLASWIVSQLLDEGQAVHGTVRSLADGGRIAHLKALGERYPGRLKLFEADLLAPRSFDAAMAGCRTVIHAASPYSVNEPRDAERDLVAPARDGTRNVLGSVERTASVTRVVVTSSVVALYNDACSLASRAGHLVTDRDVSDIRDVSDNPYAYSKTVAERAAWEIHDAQSRWSMVTVHPGAILGPSLSTRRDATSVDMMIKFLDGSYRPGVPRLWLGFVDVRDVALVHVRAAFDAPDRARFVAVSETMTLLELARQMDPAAAGLRNRLPRRESPKALVWLIAPFVGLRRRYVQRNVGHPLAFDASGTRDALGIVFRPVARTVDDHIRQIARDGMVRG